jgi:hypothetical protein
MAEWWKLKREINRLGLQVSELRPYFQGPLNRLYYDQFKRSEVVISEGDQGAKKNAAVVLIYQPNGILPSTVQQLDHLIAHGITPVLVSNAKLADADRILLRRKCLFVLERPNFGYDFGGYRDAILEFLDRGLSVQNLFVLNDSIWFPIRPDCTLLETAMKDEADLFGIFYSRKSKKRSHWHLHSYFYRFSARVVESPAFRRYWSKMPLYTGSKRIVIRQFETKLTAYFLSKGFTADSLIKDDDVRRATRELDNADVHKLLEYNIRADPLSRSIFRSLEGLTPADQGWRSKVESLVMHSKFGNYFLNAHPLVFLDGLKSPILKKNRDHKFVCQRQEIFALGLDADLLPTVREEAKNWDAG